jgi:transcriptional regulator with XRE-family HTH domain
MNKKSKVVTTFDEFMKNSKQKEKFDKEYSQFLIKEFLLEAMNEYHISVRKLSEKSGVSTSIIQNIRSDKIANITVNTLSSLMNTLGYRMTFEKINKNKNLQKNKVSC